MYTCAQKFGLGIFLSFGLNHFNVYCSSLCQIILIMHLNASQYRFI